ncbi:MAG: hypothetical protein HY537_16225 [Deltaproteobacteria bacterium]|nr:hypothetical protein [Deltaproteobacteria bacterium]
MPFPNNVKIELHKLVDQQLQRGRRTFRIKCAQNLLQDTRDALLEHPQVREVTDYKLDNQMGKDLLVTVEPLPRIEISYDNGVTWYDV